MIATALLVFVALHPLLLVLFWAWAASGLRVFALLGFLPDVLLNFTTASLIWGLPQLGEWTISKRLARQRFDEGRRGRLAWRLTELLNRIKPDHI